MWRRSEDNHGVLILSRFAGAAQELVDALVVNPYDTEELADSIRHALEMRPEERRQRMQRMRTVIREHNVYRWAANLIGELCEIRTPGARGARLRNWRRSREAIHSRSEAIHSRT